MPLRPRIKFRLSADVDDICVGTPVYVQDHGWQKLSGEDVKCYVVLVTLNNCIRARDGSLIGKQYVRIEELISVLI